MTWVTIRHPEIENDARCHSTAIPVWEARGWRVVGEAEPPQPHPLDPNQSTEDEVVPDDPDEDQ